MFEITNLENRSVGIQSALFTYCRAPRWCSSKESTCQCRRFRSHGFILWLEKIPWRRKWQPTPMFLPGKFQGQRSPVGCSPLGRKESDTAERVYTVNNQMSLDSWDVLGCLTLPRCLLVSSCHAAQYMRPQTTSSKSNSLRS